MAFLVLKTGEIFSGRFLGGKEQAGEVVFNTAHSGYEEMATDPSYFSQIVVMTAPHQGNYGESDAFWQSENIWIKGFVCLKMFEHDSSWKEKLIARGVPVLEDVDTRSVVLNLRKKGSVYGAIVQSDDSQSAKQRALELIGEVQNLSKDWPYLISSPKIKRIKGFQPGGLRIVVLDFGCKSNIIEELKKRVSELVVFPPRSSAEDIIKENPSAVLLSNGPGDPSYVEAPAVQKLLGKYFMFGICMGCQVLALALGGKTRKLKFGHRGVNHPVKDSLHDQIYITSQNHGYAVVEGSLPPGVEVTHVNLNDRTIQGFYSKKHKVMAVQFHPENHPGPRDSLFLFDRFIKEAQN